MLTLHTKARFRSIKKTWKSVGFVIVTCFITIIFAVGILAFQQINRLGAAQDEVLRVEGSLAEIESLKSATYQAESETRAFIVSGRSSLLTSQIQKMNAAVGILDKLEASLPHTPIYSRRFREIREAMRLRFAFLQGISDTREHFGIEAVTPLVATGNSLLLQRNLRDSIDALQSVDQELLIESTQKTQHELRLACTLILFAALPAVVVLSILTLVTAHLLRRSNKLGSALKSVNGTLSAVLNAAPVGIFSYSPDAQVTLWNTAAENLFGIDAPSIVHKSLASMSLDLQNLISQCDPVAIEDREKGEEPTYLTWRREAGDDVKIKVSAAPVITGESTSPTIVAIVQDVTATLKLQHELLQVAHHDSLTGLPNRVVLSDRFEQMLKRTRRDGKKCAVFEIDVDRFKQVNDLHGHETGDLFLRQVAMRLAWALRTTDTMVRVDGDEFVCLVESLNRDEDAELVASKLMASLAEPITLDGISLQASISIGMALFPVDGTKCAQLRKQADTALYRAKAAGRGRFMRYERNDADVRRRQIQQVLENGISNGSFFIEYQPQYTKKSELRGFEALLRLTDPSLGLVSPGEFIPIAEQCGLIHEIGTWVLRESCITFADWVRRGYKPGVLAVNVSAAQFVRGNFVEIVADTLLSSGLSPRYLELELTETMVMCDIGESSSQMHRLKRAGISLAIDDFGTGYSSLSHLHRLPIDLMKIDRSFVNETNCENKTTRPIVEAILALGKSLSIEVLAEGVESEEQRRYLCKVGCDYLQGYLFARPMPASDVVARFAEVQDRRAVEGHASFGLRELPV